MMAACGKGASVGSIGVALSGGGHRATTWGLGVLLYLCDAGKNREVSSIASVSGGSIANGFVADRVAYDEAGGDDFRAAMRPLARNVAQEGLFAFGPATNRYLYGLIALLVAVGAGGLAWLVGVAALVLGQAGAFEVVGWAPPGWLARPTWLGWLTVALAALAGCALLLLGRRSVVVDRALARVHFSDGGRPRLLGELDRRVGHVLCATELQSAEHLYLAPRFVSSYRFGVGEPGGLPLSTAVQCSACLPGAFRPRRLPTAGHRFRPFAGVRPPQTPQTMVLSDGGVYDNMADQWHQGFDERLRRWPELADIEARPEELIVANASGGWRWSPIKRWGLLRGEAVGLLRAKDILYEVTTAHRRQGLVGRFDRAALQHEGLRGALVHIQQSPWDIAERWSKAGDRWPERAERARAVLAALEAGPLSAADWERIAAETSAVATTLGALGEDVTARLLHHAYALAMCNLHIILGYPLLDLPDEGDLRALVA